MRAAHWMSSAAVGVLALASAAAWADPPERVGRLSFTQGDVSVQPPTGQEWLPVARNYPVTRDEAFWTEPGALAELQIGPVDAFMDSSTELQIDELDYGVLQLSLPEGAIHVELSRVPDGGVRIETPQGEIRLVEPGSYRIDSGAPENGDRDTVLVTTLSGRAEIAGPNILAPVERGQTAEIDNDYRIAMGRGGAEASDDFASRRLGDERYTATPQYVSDEYSGYEDLGAYGDWEQTADYGAVWYPRGVAADWAPYRDGHWDYVEPWGWTWIDDAPWGFTPFHYGRWTQVRGRWCWAPGEFARRPIYAPALVSFIGGGPGFGVDLSVGWVPLAPREVYRPWYGGYSTNYVRNINITNVDRVTVNRITVDNIRNVTVNNYHNDHARTFVRQDDFRRAAPVQRVALRGNGPGNDGRHDSFAIDKLRPAARDGGPNGQGAHGHAPRVDSRHFVMKAPSPNVVPQQPTTPRLQPGGVSDRRTDGHNRGVRNGQQNNTQVSGQQNNGRFSDGRPNDGRPMVTGDHRQPPLPPGRAFGQTNGQQTDDRRASDERRGRLRGQQQTTGPTNGQPNVQGDNRQPGTTGDRQRGRSFGADNNGQNDNGNDRRGRFSGSPNTPSPQVTAPVQTPTVTPDPGRESRRRGPQGWQGQGAPQGNPTTPVNGQTPTVNQPQGDRGGWRNGQGNRFNPGGQPSGDQQQRFRREEPRQPVVAAPQPQQQPQPQQDWRQGRGQGGGDHGGGQERHREQPQPQQQAQPQPQPAANNSSNDNSQHGRSDDDRRKRHDRN